MTSPDLDEPRARRILEIEFEAGYQEVFHAGNADDETGDMVWMPGGVCRFDEWLGVRFDEVEGEPVLVVSYSGDWPRSWPYVSKRLVGNAIHEATAPLIDVKRIEWILPAADPRPRA